MYTTSFMPTTLSPSGAWGIISLVLAIVGGIAAYIVFLAPKNEKKFTGFVKWLYDFLSFKFLTIEVILKVVYIIAAIYTTLSAFGFIGTSAILFFGTLIIGNLVLRLAFEGALLLIMMYKNTKDIRDSLKK